MPVYMPIRKGCVITDSIFLLAISHTTYFSADFKGLHESIFTGDIDLVATAVLTTRGYVTKS